MKAAALSLLTILLCAAIVLPGVASSSARPAQKLATATPPELVATYQSLADAILAVKASEANLVRSILGSSYAHAQAEIQRARQALADGNKNEAGSAMESLAALVGHLGTEGDNAVAAVRKRLLEGGHHHNALGEQKGVFDPGFVIVTRDAKKSFLDASREIGRLSRSPDADQLERVWSGVQSTWAGLMKTK